MCLRGMHCMMGSLGHQVNKWQLVIRSTQWARVHGARTVHSAQYTAFTPQLDPHRKVLDSNIGTKKTAKKRVSHQFLAV